MEEQQQQPLCALAQAEVTKPAITQAPEGWKLVPIEPTEDMIVHGFESWPDRHFSEPEVWEEYEKMSGCQQAAFRAKLCWAAMVAAAPALRIQTQQNCGCRKCNSISYQMTHFIVCETCGNKRCPHATDHDLPCTDSNEPGQPGSIYTGGRMRDEVAKSDDANSQKGVDV